MLKPDQKIDRVRRDILKAGVAIGCGSILCSCQPGMNSDNADEKLKVLSPDGYWVEVNKAQISKKVETELDIRKGLAGRKFVMVIDLAKCKNARKCITACQKMHRQPEDKEWVQVKLLKDSEKGAPYWFPKTCFHCDNPPCVKVCPVSATFKREDGLVLIDNDRCIGCKFCMAACPYSTRVFNWGETDVEAAGPYMCSDDAESGYPSQVGTVEKCDFCPGHAAKGELPDCVTACPNGVFYFGDEYEDTVTNGSETVRFSHLLKDKAGYRYMEDLGTEPRVYYLPPTDRIFPAERGIEELPDGLKEMFGDIIQNS